MSYITLQVTPHGLVCDALISVSGPRRDALQKAKQPIPGVVPIRALIDTGASHTFVDPSVIAPLGLTPTGPAMPINSATTGATPANCDQYDVSLFIPCPKDFPFMKSVIPVGTLDLLASVGLHALIGRDILSECLLVYNGKEGTFALGY